MSVQSTAALDQSSAGHGKNAKAARIPSGRCDEPLELSVQMVLADPKLLTELRIDSAPRWWVISPRACCTRPKPCGAQERRASRSCSKRANPAWIVGASWSRSRSSAAKCPQRASSATTWLCNSERGRCKNGAAPPGLKWMPKNWTEDGQSTIVVGAEHSYHQLCVQVAKGWA